MHKPIMKFIFIVGISFSSAILSLKQLNDSTFLEFPTYTNSYQCKDDIALNFSNTYITDIGSDFISNPLVTCLNLMNNSIKNIAKDAFRSLPNLTHLFLSNNNIHSSNGIYNFGTHQTLNVLVLNNIMSKENEHIIGEFGNYPNLEILLARNNNFKDLKSEIILSDFYTSLTEKILFPKLKFLDLSENSIGYFRNDLSLSERFNKREFMNLLSNTLQFLDLHDNMLNFLILREQGSNLHVLNVNNNYFRNVMYTSIYYDDAIASLDLAYLNNLQYLSISENKIEAISLNAFQDSNKLIYLNLSKNYINYLHPDTFANLHFLQVLDLSSNQINYVPPISNEININLLDLSCNKIKSIIANGFIQTPKLTKLLLEGNQIYQINAKAFARLSALEELNLSNNKLNSLPEEWTESLTSLKYLNLSNNTFISLESLSLQSALSLTEVYLVMNPLEYTNIRYAENLPQSLTVYLTQKSNFSCKCIA